MSTTPTGVDRPLRSGWTALTVTVVARMLLTILTTLLLSAVLPSAFGAHPTVVMTGSMLPRLVPGDVVFSRPVAPADLQLGQVLLYDDPDQRNHLRMHRWVDIAPDGRLITKGDANPQRDSTPVDRSAVVGVASLRVPFVARPVVWVADGRGLPLVLTGLGLLLTVAAACWFRAGDEDEADDDDASAGGTPADDTAGEDTATPTGDPEHRARRRLVQAGVSLVAVTLLGLGTAATAHAATARVSATTTGPASTFASSAYFSCAAAARATGARFSWPLGESGGSTAQDVTVNNVDGTYAGGVTYGVPGPCRADGTTGVTLNGTSGAVASSLAADSIPELTTSVWVKAVPGSRGGTLVSFTDGGFLGLFPSSSFAVGMGTGGTLTFAFLQNNAKLVVAGGPDLRDNAWHQVAAVAGTGGMALYVDGAVVASNQGVPVSTTSVVGTPRIGYGVATSLGTSASNYFQGSVAFPTVWKSSLSAATILATYRAAS